LTWVFELAAALDGFDDLVLVEDGDEVVDGDVEFEHGFRQHGAKLFGFPFAGLELFDVFNFWLID
tara:strand:- start:412 stop:606 length:195 start_codon:yes stop_codon:yes gene_type:complete